MPKMTGKDKKQKELIAGLEQVFMKVSKTHGIPPGDFPDVNRYRHALATLESCRDFKAQEARREIAAAVGRGHSGALHAAHV